MTKVVLTNIVASDGEVTKAGSINANSTSITNAIEKTLSRDGTTPNEMGATLDMNSNRIINLLQAVSSTEPVRKLEFDLTLGNIQSAAASLSAALGSINALNAFQATFPTPFAGRATQSIRVNAGETGYEFFVPSGVTDGNKVDITVSGGGLT